MSTSFNVALIIRLLNWRSPAAVVGFVVSVIVFSVNRMKRSWPFSHVFKKAKEPTFFSISIPPSFANRYPSSSVIFVSLVLCVVATCIHHVPRSKEAALASPVDGLFHPHDFRLKTTTRSGVFGVEVIGWNFCFRAAFASAFPNSFVPFIPAEVLYYGQSTVSLSMSVSEGFLRVDRGWSDDNSILVLAHVMDGLSSSARQPFKRLCGRAFCSMSNPEAQQSTGGDCPL